ncbi:MAG: TIGR00730 family Rossman fold protein [Mogibacterium sp.]|nr:TIGR00730 family Rossman fold protein [Mogibacterium sp.]
MNITVYCGAAEGMDPEFAARARELGAWMAKHGHVLVYGAGNSGMMGAVSDSLIENGGSAIGVTPEFFVLAEETRSDLDEVILADDMSTRRNWMIEHGDAFIALPGGMGTLDEITEVMTY